MGLPVTVQRGDSLWSLAGRYLGRYERYPEIFEYHNKYVGSSGLGRRGLIPIENPDLIFVGQTVMIPYRGTKTATPPSRVKPAPTRQPIPLEGRYDFTLDPKTSDNPRYKRNYEESHTVSHGSKTTVTTGTVTIESELSGKITLESLSIGQSQLAFDLAVSKDGFEVSQKLRKSGATQAFTELTAEMELGDFVEGPPPRIYVRPKLSAVAGAGPVRVALDPIGPLKFSGSVTPEPVTGTFTCSDGRRWRFTAAVTISVTVTVSPRADMPKEPIPRGINQPQTVRDTQPVSVAQPSGNWNRPLVYVGCGVAAVGVVVVVTVKSPVVVTAAVTAVAWQSVRSFFTWGTRSLAPAAVGGILTTHSVNEKITYHETK